MHTLQSLTNLHLQDPNQQCLEMSDGILLVMDVWSLYN